MSKVDTGTDTGGSGNGGGGLAVHSCGPLCPETHCPQSPDLALTQVICSFIKSKSLPHAPPGGPGGELIGLFVTVILFSAAIMVWSQRDDRPKQLCRNGCKDGLSALTWAGFQSQSDHFILCYWRNHLFATRVMICFIVSWFCLLRMTSWWRYSVCAGLDSSSVFLRTLAPTAAGHLSRVSSSQRGGSWDRNTFKDVTESLLSYSCRVSAMPQYFLSTCWGWNGLKMYKLFMLGKREQQRF